MTVTQATTTDYLYVDGYESITLSQTSLSITVATAKRSRIEATAQLTGIQPGDVLWDLAAAEVTGTITVPLAGGFITDTDSTRYVIKSVSKLVVSQIWQCLTALSDTYA